MFFSIVYNFKSYLILMVCGFLAGILLFCKTDISFVVYCIIFLTVLCILLFIQILFRFAAKERLPRVSVLTLMFVIFMIIGAVRTATVEYELCGIFREIGDDEALFSGRVIKSPETIKASDRKWVYVKLSSYLNNGEEKKINSTVKLSYKSSINERVKYGSQIEFYGKPEKFNYKYSLGEKGNNVSAQIGTAYCVNYGNSGNLIGVVGIGNTLKIKIVNAIEEIFKYSPKSAATLKGIITGDTGDFSASLYNGFKDAGFMHVAAVSGTHVSILFSIVSIMLSTFSFKRSMSTGVAIVILFVFCSVAGFTSSAVRATIMLTVSLLAVFVDREYDMKTALFFSAFVILLIHPYKLFSPGFLLSFGATLGISLFYRPVRDCFESLEKRIYVPSFVSSSLSLSLAAFLGTMPFCMNFFDSINFISLITNMWIIPVVTIAFTIGLFASVMFYVCPWVSVNILRYLCEPFLFVIIKTAELFCGKNIGIINFDFIPTGYYIIYVGAIIIFYKIIKAREV